MASASLKPVPTLPTANDAFQAETADMLKQDGWFSVKCLRLPNGAVLAAQRVFEEVGVRTRAVRNRTLRPNGA